MPIFQQAGPDVVPLDVFDPEVVKVFERARYLHIKRHLTSTRVVGLARAEEGEEGLAAISMEQLGSYSQSCVGRWWLDIYDFVTLSPESRDGALKGTSTGWGRIHHAFIESTSCSANVRRTRITICPHNTNLEPLLNSNILLLVCPPLNGMYTMIPLPRLHPNETPREVNEILQCPCHRAKYTGYTLLPRHTRIHTHLWPSTRTTPQRVDT